MRHDMNEARYLALTYVMQIGGSSLHRISHACGGHQRFPNASNLIPGILDIQLSRYSTSGAAEEERRE